MSISQALAIRVLWLVVTIAPDSGPGHPMAGGHYRPELRPWQSESYAWWSLSAPGQTQALAIQWLVVTVLDRTQALVVSNGHNCLLDCSTVQLK